MSRRRSPGAHVAVKAPPAGSVRRNLGFVIAAGAVLALGGSAADAADGDHLVVGSSNSASNSTGVSTTSGYGLYGSTSALFNGAGVYGGNTGGGDGVYGFSVESDGVYGTTQASAGSGVHGSSFIDGGSGVIGEAGDGGVGVWAEDLDGTAVALRTTGKIQFQKRSNTIVIASGQKSRTISIPGVTAASRVLATVQRTGGYFVQAVVPGPGSFTIYINKAAPAPETVPVGYLVIN